MTEPLTVLHVINQLACHGGAEVSLLETLPRLQALGVRNVVVPLVHYDDGAAERLRAQGVVVVPSPGGSLPMVVTRLQRLIRAQRPDLVHTTLFDSDLAGRLAAKLSGVPVITSLVNMQYEPEARPVGVPAWKFAAVRAVDSLLARRATTVLHAITDAVASSAQRRLGVDPRHIEVIPRGRDLRALGDPSRVGRDDVLRRLGLPATAELVLNVARHEAQKGQVHLIRAFSSVARARPEAHLLVAGRSGSATVRMEELVAACGLAGRVHLLGARNDVPDLLRACDVFAFTSLWEGLGGAVLEAMALEAPVVAFDIAPVREVLSGEGVLVKPRDVQGLAEAVIDVLSNPWPAAERAQRARRRFLDKHDLDVVVLRTLALYHRVAHEDEPSDPYAADDVLEHYRGLDALMPAEKELFSDHVPAGSRVLDLGVGTGRTTAVLSTGAEEYVGIDLSEAMVAACRSAHPGEDFRVGDASDLGQFGDCSFDVVVFSYNGIDHLMGDARAACLSEVARVLVPGGIFIFSGHNPRAVLVLPRTTRVRRGGRTRVVASSALRTCRRATRLLHTQAFWFGSGPVHDPVHGGLDFHVATPRHWARACALAGLELVAALPCGQYDGLSPLETDWYYYAFRRTDGPSVG